MLGWLTQHVTASPLTYLVVALAAGGDVILPLIPSETLVITAAVLAAQGRLSLWLIVPPVAAGAFIGDNVVYWLGRGVGDPVSRRLFKGETARRRLEWAERAIRGHGARLVLAGRFIPGGRTASTFAAGTLDLAYPSTRSGATRWRRGSRSATWPGQPCPRSSARRPSRRTARTTCSSRRPATRVPMGRMATARTAAACSCGRPSTGGSCSAASRARRWPPPAPRTPADGGATPA
jgi:membrane protein YqaA with SNARE-associated domain